MQQFLLPAFSVLILTIFVALVRIPKSLCEDEQHVICGEPFRCGELTFSYPFWGGNRPRSCGYPGLELTCQSNAAFLTSESMRYRLLAIDGSQQSLTVARDDLWNGLCPKFIYNTTFNYNIFSYSPGYQNVTLYYGCTIVNSSFQGQGNQLHCTMNTTTNTTTNFYSKDAFSIKPTDAVCYRSISVPVNQAAAENLGNSAALQAAINGGFGLRWAANNSICQACLRSGGRCGYNSAADSFSCYCPDQPYNAMCDNAGNDKGKNGLRINWPVAILVILFGAGGLLLIGAGVCYLIRTCSPWEGTIWWKLEKGSNQKIEAFVRNHGSLAPKFYSFSEIKRMTDSFAHLLGQGGCGCVYKGKLSDGCQVAVKVLSDNKGNGEEFINEVASISRTAHLNVVSLLGFCYKADRKALVYEFMCNGSLDKYIYNKNESPDADCRLEWKVLYQIALGTARGLEYLHQGCNTRIVHFDIKPHNILLDKDFCPKISDFGLAKLCMTRESVLSTIGARGTAGYMAPEVFFRGLGGISNKSDVYSFGMMVLEMVGVKSRIQVDTEKSSETYFPNWIYERFELEKGLGLEGVMNAEQEEAAMKMILVGLWCIQTRPSDRPSMNKVVEMLEGSIEDLQFPPKPYLLDSSAAISEASFL